MGIGSITFSLPHFLTTAYSETYNSDGTNSSIENICNGVNGGGVGRDSVLRKSFASRLDNLGSSSEGELLQKLPGLETIKSLTKGTRKVHLYGIQGILHFLNKLYEYLSRWRIT